MLQHLNREDTTEAFAEVLERDGALVIDNLLTAEQCDTLMDDFQPHIDGADWCNATPGDIKDDFFGLRSKRFHGLTGLSGGLSVVISHPDLLRIAYQQLGAGDRCRDIRVSTMELMILGEGESRQKIHRDFDSWPYVPRLNDEVCLLSANIAMCDFTATNGATVVVPGSHQWRSDRLPESGDSCQATMSKGSALIYTGHVLHGGGSNMEPILRTGLYIGYIVSWLAPLENHAVSAPQDSLSALDDKSRRLLGIMPDGFMVVP